jgi:glutaredoxin
MKKIILIIGIFLIIFLMGCESTETVNFAKCLTDNGVKMYGAFWCPHCARQKEMFGSTFEHVNYVECSLPDKSGQTEVCKEAVIKTYPTWEFGDGSRVEGVQTLEDLSRTSGCKMEG